MKTPSAHRRAGPCRLAFSLLAVLISTLALSEKGWADDRGTNFATAAIISVGSVTSGTISPDRDRDVFKFTVASNATYVMYTRGTLNTQGNLYNGTYGLLASDHWGGEDGNFRIEYVLSPGTYYVETYSTLRETGPYEFHLEGSGAGTVSDDHGFSCWSATVAPPGSVIQGVIDTEGDADYFKFTVASKATYVMYTRGCCFGNSA